MLDAITECGTRCTLVTPYFGLHLQVCHILDVRSVIITFVIVSIVRRRIKNQVVEPYRSSRKKYGVTIITDGLTN